MSTQDYRVSTIVVLCKDCNNDVGLYPGRHVCPPRPAMPAMPSIPSKYQQQSSTPSSYSNRSNAPSSRMRPPDLNSEALKGNSYGSSSGGGGYGSSSRTPTSSSFQDRLTGGSKTPTTASSFQERMKERDQEKQQREREERENALRGLREERFDASPTPAAATPATPAAGSGTTLWNRLRAAKEVINATLTGEEKWPESDDSDHEGESHVCRVLREYADKKDEAEMAAKIAQLEMTPYDQPVPSSGSLSRSTGGASRNNYLRDAARKEPSPSITSSTSSGDRERDDAYGRSLRARAGGADPSERSWSPSNSSISTSTSTNSYGSSNLNVGGGGNRYRTVSDASRDDALSRLEGKSQGDALANQVSHLGSTGPRARANSPNLGYRPQEPIQVPSPRYQQQQLSPSSAGGNYSSSPSQRSISPGNNRRYDPPSPNGSGSPMRYGQQPPVSPGYPSPQYRQQQPPPSPSRNDYYNTGGGRRHEPPPPHRSDYDRRQPGPGPAGNNNNNLGAYGQRQQYQQQQQQQARSPYGAGQGNYI
ncbi:hypothetical protein BGZ83_011202 [Gryganskiella cystojenkinii]|nr:hypothetical protein BGZ83_011202 [Gryganskiella cystojenkinii]